MSIVDRIALDLGLVKSYVQIDHVEDNALLTLMAGVAKEQADLFLGNEFMTGDEEGYTTYQDIPLSVILGCLKCVHEWYYHRVAVDVLSERIGDTTTQFGEVPEAAKRLWRPYRKNPGL
jgi:hypothetical protein